MHRKPLISCFKIFLLLSYMLYVHSYSNYIVLNYVIRGGAYSLILCAEVMHVAPDAVPVKDGL